MKWRSRDKVADKPEETEAAASHRTPGEGETGAGVNEEHQARLTLEEDRHLTEDLMEKICSKSNFRLAYRQVKRNKGAAGIDGMTTDAMPEHFKTHIEELLASLLKGSYRPEKVLGIKIPKPGGGSRLLGIPTVVDRVIQQAIAQVLGSVFERKPPIIAPRNYGGRTVTLSSANGIQEELSTVFARAICSSANFCRTSTSMLLGSKVAGSISLRRSSCTLGSVNYFV